MRNSRGEAHPVMIGGLTGLGVAALSGAVVVAQGFVPPDSLLLPLVQTLGAPATLLVLWWANQRRGKQLSHLETRRLEQVIERQTKTITDAFEKQQVTIERMNANSLTILNAQIELHLEKHASRLESAVERRREPRSG